MNNLTLSEAFIPAFASSLLIHIISVFLISSRQHFLIVSGRPVTRVNFLSTKIKDRFESSLFFANIFMQGGSGDFLFVLLVWIWRLSGLAVMAELFYFASLL